MPYVKSLREVRVITVHGDSVIVPPNQAKEIPARLLEAAISAGCAQCDEKGKLILGEIPEPKVDADDIPFLSVEERKDVALRQKVIKLAIQHIYKRNDRSDFKGDGFPRNNAVETLVRFPVGNAEIMEVLEQLEAAE